VGLYFLKYYHLGVRWPEIRTLKTCLNWFKVGKTGNVGKDFQESW
jgi:hypothetical protein